MIQQTKFQQRTRSLLLAAACLLGVVQYAGAQAIKVIDYSTTSWRYLTNKFDPLLVPADAWIAPAFDDSAWPSGFGIFGQEASAALYTTAQAGFDACQCPFNTYITSPGAAGGVASYFRTHFDWSGGAGGVTLRFTNYVDDSVVVYLNGTVLYTFNVAADKVLPMLWNDANPSGVANPLGEGVPFVTNVVANGLVTGDNVLAVQLQNQGAGSSDNVFTLNMWATPPTPIVITQNPTNRTVAENRTVIMTVGVTGTAPSFQWFKDDVAILDATNQTYTIASTVVGDTGDYKVRVSNVLNTLTSTVGRLTVVVDVNGPILSSIRTDDTFQKIIVTWDELIAEGSAIEVGNYYIYDSLSNQVTVTAAAYNGNSVVLTVPTLQVGADYAVEITFQSDLVGNPTPPQGVPTVDPANGVVSSFYTWTITRGFTRFQAYLGRPPAESLATFVTLPVYPDGSSFSFYTNLANWPQTAPNVEQYVMRFSGLFVATEDGTHNFDAAHDDDMRLRVFASEDASGAFTELAAACCTGLTGGPTLDVALVAGNRYYYELLVREITGGDVAGLAVTLPSTTVVSPISAQYLAIAADPLAAPNVGIAAQPQSITIPQNHTATFSVTATNVGGGASYQWQISTGGPFSDIGGANAASYTTPLRALTDSGNQYRVLVSVPGRTLTSAVATLTVVNDLFPPHIIAVRSSRNLNTVTVVFDEVMDPGTVGEATNFELKDSGNVVLELTVPVLSGDNRSVTFTTPVQTPGGIYTLSAQDVTDLVGNPIEATNLTFQAWVLSRGFAYFEAYDTGGGNEVSILTAHPTYPNSPRDVAFIPSFDSRNAYPNDTHEAYGARLSGFFTATATTNYIFYFSADDGSELSMSPDSNPANKVVLRATSTCCTANSVNPATNALVAGQTYYIELLYKEGTGGDYGRVVVKTAGDPANPDNLAPISGLFLSTLADPTGASVTLTQQPANATFVIAAGSSVLLNENLNSSDGGFTVTTPLAMDGPWTYSSGDGSWIYNGQDPENSHPNTSILTTPANAVTTLGNVVMTFSHRHSFEGGSWDGGQIRVSKNGGPFVAVPLSAFLQNGYNGSVLSGSSSELANQTAYVNDSTGHAGGTKITSICDLGLFSPGDQIRIQFFAASDTNTRGSVPNWEVDSVQLSQGNGPSSVTFRVGADAVNADGPNPPRFYQWYRNNGAGFTAIAGANAATYTIIPVAGDNGAQFRAEVLIPGAGAVSTSATLTVVGGVAAPALAVRSSGANVVLAWPVSATGYTAEGSPVLPAVTWTAVGPIVVVGSENTITIPVLQNTNRFYRLIK